MNNIFSQTARLSCIDEESKTPIFPFNVYLPENDSLINTCTDSFCTIYFRNKILIKSPNYFSKTINLDSKKLKHKTTIKIILEPFSVKTKDITVVTNKAYEKQSNTASRIEIVDKEELVERSLDKPSSVSHAVKEQTGVQLQRTSAASGAFNIRLQSLRGKYVQILKDGLPLFNGLSQYLALPHTSPINLQQIEIIKGPSSILYGGDAIAGVLNFISITPTDKPIYDIITNVETTKSVDAMFFASHRIKKIGFNFLGQYRNQQPMDWDKDGFSDYAKINRWQVAPELFFWLNKVNLNLGVTYSNEDRIGGAMMAITDKFDSTYNYKERNKSEAICTKVKAQIIADKFIIHINNGINFYKRNLTAPNVLFRGKQLATYSEVGFNTTISKHRLSAGLDLRTDMFNDQNKDSLTGKSYNILTFGIYVQEVFSIKKTILEAGIRFDYNKNFGFTPLPKVSWLQKWNDIFHTRLNIAMGYKLPTIFQDESEEILFRNILPIDPSLAKRELSLGGTLDLKVKAPSINGFQISLNEMFFLTNIWSPVLPNSILYKGQYYTQFVSKNGTIQGRGIESTLNLGYRGVGFKFSYTLQDQNININNVKSVAPLTSKHMIGLLLGYEKEGKFSIGTDCYYFSPSVLSDGTPTNGIWEMGINGQYIHRFFTIFANAENLLNIRQTSFGPVVSPNPTFQQPRFKEIYAPLEGRILNVGLKIRLGNIFSKNRKVNDDDD